MREESVTIRLADGTSEGFLFRSDEKQHPGVICLTDVFGIRPAAREKAQRIAAEGYAVLLPNIFHRIGSPPFLEQPANWQDPKTQQRLNQLRGSLPPEAMERDASAYVDFVSSQSGVRAGKTGIVGYCFSGAMALRAAAARPDKIAAAASFHGGGLFTDSPASPHTVLPRVKASLYFGHADGDRSMTNEAIEKFEQALRAWGGKFESETYEGARHGWTALDSEVYNAPQAGRAFEKLKQLFATALR